MSGWLKAVLAVACVAALGAGGYFAYERFGQDDEALSGARQARGGECDDANATMALVRKGQPVPPQMLSQKDAEWVLTTMTCPKAP